MKNTFIRNSIVLAALIGCVGGAYAMDEGIPADVVKASLNQQDVDAARRARGDDDQLREAKKLSQEAADRQKAEEAAYFAEQMARFEQASQQQQAVDPSVRVGGTIQIDGKKVSVLATRKYRSCRVAQLETLIQDLGFDDPIQTLLGGNTGCSIIALHNACIMKYHLYDRLNDIDYLDQFIRGYNLTVSKWQDAFIDELTGFITRSKGINDNFVGITLIGDVDESGNFNCNELVKELSKARGDVKKTCIVRAATQKQGIGGHYFVITIERKDGQWSLYVVDSKDKADHLQAGLYTAPSVDMSDDVSEEYAQIVQNNDQNDINEKAQTKWSRITMIIDAVNRAEARKKPGWFSCPTVTKGRLIAVTGLVAAAAYFTSDALIWGSLLDAFS